MPYSDLFIWWVMSISWSIVFLTIASTYLYVDSRKKKTGTSTHSKVGLPEVIRHFIFVWVLLGLLCLYIVSINKGSSLLFASGNIVTEIALIIYTFRNRTGK